MVILACAKLSIGNTDDQGQWHLCSLSSFTKNYENISIVTACLVNKSSDATVHSDYDLWLLGDHEHLQLYYLASFVWHDGLQGQNIPEVPFSSSFPVPCGQMLVRYNFASFRGGQSLTLQCTKTLYCGNVTTITSRLVMVLHTISSVLCVFSNSQKLFVGAFIISIYQNPCTHWHGLKSLLI